MKINSLKSHFLLFTFIFIASIMLAQTDSTQVVQEEVSTAEEQQTKEKKRKDEFKVFGGANFNILNMDTELLNPAFLWDIGLGKRKTKKTRTLIRVFFIIN